MDSFWDDCELVTRVEGLVSGAPVVRDEQGNPTRLPADTLVGNVESFMELKGMTEDQAIEATIEQFPKVYGGKDTLRELLTYQAVHANEAQPS